MHGREPSQKRTGMTRLSSDEQDLSADGLVGPLFSQSETEERAVLNAVLSTGFDQGWLLRPKPGELLRDASVVDSVLEQIAGRPQARPDVEDPWRDGSPLPAKDLGEEPGWVILTQRCDLIRGYTLEPLVELVRAVRVVDRNEARKARINSTRLISIESDDVGLWAADMRTRAWLPKHLLPLVDAQPVVASAASHKRFRHRLGGRYWRDAVPDDLRDSLGVPMAKAFSKGDRNRLLRHFSMLLGRRVEGQVMVLAVMSPDASEDDAIADWDDAMSELGAIDSQARAMVHPDSESIAEEDLSVAEWLDCFKFDFDDLTYGSRASADQAPSSL